MINSEIALQGKPVQFDIQTPINLMNQGRQMLMQQQQLQMQRESHAQQMEAGGIDLKEKQLQLQDEQKMRQAWQQANGDPDQMFSIAGQMGVGPKTMLQTQQSLTQMREAKAKLTAAELENANLKNDQLHALLDPVVQETDPQKQAALWDQQQHLGLQRGLLTIADVRQHPYPGSPDQVQSYVSSLNTDKWVTSAAAKSRAESAAASAKTAKDRLDLEAPGLELKNQEAQRSQDAIDLAAAAKQGPDALGFMLRKLSAASPDRIEPFMSINAKSTPDDILKIGMKPDQAATVQGQADARQETARHNKVDEGFASGRLKVEQGNLDLARKKNEMEYGAGTADFWVHQLQDNPDSVKELPPAMRSKVGFEFTKATGLPLPTALSGQTQQAETAARNALDGISFIRQALQNPEIQKQIGPIMGRLGNAEQRIGSAVGLSPEAEQLAQELRTRMRYFVFQEGKAVLGGRLPAPLMQALEQSSPNVKMDAGTMLGAVKGAEDNAQSVMDNADKQRFGGKMRSREMRGQGGAAGAVPEVTNQADYDKLPRGAKYTNNGVPHVKQ